MVRLIHTGLYDFDVTHVPLHVYRYSSGTLDFDEFVTMIRKLKPASTSDNRQAGHAQLAGFEALRTSQDPICSALLQGLYQVVPPAGRVSAGAVLFNLRGLGFADDGAAALLLALFAWSPLARASDDDPDAPPRIPPDSAATNLSTESRLVALRAAWTVLGGAVIVRTAGSNAMGMRQSMFGGPVTLLTVTRLHRHAITLSHRHTVPPCHRHTHLLHGDKVPPSHRPTVPPSRLPTAPFPGEPTGRHDPSRR